MPYTHLRLHLKCVGCKRTRDYDEQDRLSGDQPFCRHCYMPMVAHRATARWIKPKGKKDAGTGKV